MIEVTMQTPPTIRGSDMSGSRTAAATPVIRADKRPEEDRDREQAEAGNEESGDRAGAERQGQAALQAGSRRLRRADIGLHRHVHADEAGQAGQQSAGDEADRRDEAEEVA